MGIFGYVSDILDGGAKADKKSKELIARDNARRVAFNKGKAQLEGKSLKYNKSRVNPIGGRQGSASFGGVPFFVDSIETEFGRRISVHSFPFNSTPFSEDIGRLPRTFVVNAHVMDTTGFVEEDEYESKEFKVDNKKVGTKTTVGNTSLYEFNRNRLIKAIEGSSDNSEAYGPQDFIHPTMGTYSVVPVACSVVFDNRQGRYETFRITFKEAGERTSLDENVNLSWQIDSASGSSAIISNEKFLKNFTTSGSDLEGETSWMTELLEGDVSALFARVKEKIGLGEKDSSEYSEFFSDLDGYQKTVSQLLSVPSQLAVVYQSVLTNMNNAYTNPFTKLENAFSLFGFNTSQLLNSNSSFLVGGGSTRTIIDPESGLPIKVAVVRTPSELIAQKSRESLEELQKEILLVNLSDLITTTTYESDAQAILYKSRINEAFDEMILTNGDSDKEDANASYIILLDLKAKVNGYLNDQIEELPNVRIVEIKSVRPALVVAYNEYEDSTRFDEIVIRNGIANNLRIPIGEIEVIK